MCLLIAKPAGVSVPERHLRHAAIRNDHGLGVTWRDPAETVLHILKSPQTTPATIDQLVAKIADLTPFDALIHFRYATSGDRTEHNTHPMFVDDRRQLAVAHNGVIGQIVSNKDASDTRNFVDHVIGQLKDGWWHDAITVSQIEHLLHGDRMALLSWQDGIVLLNKQLFVDAGGVSYSNGSYEAYTPTPAYTRSPGRGYWRGGAWQDDRDDSPYAPLHGGIQRQLGAGLSKTTATAATVPFDDPIADTLVGYFYFGKAGDDYGYLCCECAAPKDRQLDVAAPVLLSEAMFYEHEICMRCMKDMTERADEVVVLLDARSESDAATVEVVSDTTGPDAPQPANQTTPAAEPMNTPLVTDIPLIH